MKTNINIFASLDIGTTKIVCAISRLAGSGQLSIQGIGVIPWEGLLKGVVTNVNKTAQTIQKAVEAAQRLAGIEVKDVWVNISGDHLRSVSNTGMGAIKNKNNEITDLDVKRAIDSARATPIPGDSKILHVIPQEFIIDSQRGIEQPVGMHGKRLETRVLICTGAVNSVQSIVKTLKKAGLKVADIVLDPLASCYAVLDKSEKKLGAALVDIGGDTTHIAIYFEDSIRYVAVAGQGSNDITLDIARTLRVPLKTAEELKIRYGSPDASGAEGKLYNGGVAGPEEKDVSKEKLATIIEPRINEILLRAKEKIKQSGYNEKPVSGIILTGGGALLPGICDRAEKIFKIHARIGLPAGLGGLVELAQSPAFATAVGLCLYAVEQRAHGGNRNNRKKIISVGVKGTYRKILDIMKLSLKDFFRTCLRPVFYEKSSSQKATITRRDGMFVMD